MPTAFACFAIFAILISCSISQTPLHLAAGGIDMMVAFGIPPLWPRLSVVQLLLQNKANVDARDMLYRPFHRIVQYISDFLLYCAYDICLCHSDFLLLIHLLSGGTPLHAAATEGYVNVCQLLINHKADAAAKDMCDPMTLAVRAHDAV